MLPGDVLEAMATMDSYLQKCKFRPFYGTKGKHRDIVAELPPVVRMDFLTNFNKFIKTALDSSHVSGEEPLLDRDRFKANTMFDQWSGAMQTAALATWKQAFKQFHYIDGSHWREAMRCNTLTACSQMYDVVYAKDTEKQQVLRLTEQILVDLPGGTPPGSTRIPAFPRKPH